MNTITAAAATTTTKTTIIIISVIDEPPLSLAGNGDALELAVGDDVLALLAVGADEV